MKCRPNTTVDYSITCDEYLVATSCNNSMRGNNQTATCNGYPVDGSSGGNNYTGCNQSSSSNFTCLRIAPSATAFIYFISNGTNFVLTNGFPY